jgi:hypothetical protein
MYFISIDPGKQGAAVLMKGNRPIQAYLFKSLKYGINVASWGDKLDTWIRKYGGNLPVFIERITAIPGQSVTSTAQQFYVLGQTEGAIMYRDLELSQIYPATWMSFAKRLNDTPQLDGKKVAQELCKKYHSSFVKKYIPRTKIHDGVADALGLAMFVMADHYVDDIKDKDLIYG